MTEEILQLLGIDLNQIQAVRRGVESDGVLNSVPPSNRLIIQFKTDSKMFKDLTEEGNKIGGIGGEKQPEMELLDFFTKITDKIRNGKKHLKRIIEKINPNNKNRLVQLLDAITHLNENNLEPEVKLEIERLQGELQDEISLAVTETYSKLMAKGRLNNLREMMNDFNKKFMAGDFLAAQQIETKINEEISNIKKQNIMPLIFIGMLQIKEGQEEIETLSSLAGYSFRISYQGQGKEQFKKISDIPRVAAKVLDAPLKTLLSDLFPQFNETIKLKNLVNDNQKMS